MVRRPASALGGCENNVKVIYSSRKDVTHEEPAPHCDGLAALEVVSCALDDDRCASEGGLEGQGVRAGERVAWVIQ